MKAFVKFVCTNRYSWLDLAWMGPSSWLWLNGHHWQSIAVMVVGASISAIIAALVGANEEQAANNAHRS